MTTTQLGNIADLLDLNDYVGEFVDHYDMDAVHADYAAAVQDLLPDGVTLLGNGDVLAECDMRGNSLVDWSSVPQDYTRAIDWETLTERIDLDAILERHDRRP